jgi:hypothetical protein
LANTALAQNWNGRFGRNARHGTIDKPVKHHIAKNKHLFGLE